MKQNLFIVAIILLLAACAHDGEETAVSPIFFTPTPASASKALAPAMEVDRDRSFLLV